MKNNNESQDFLLLLNFNITGRHQVHQRILTIFVLACCCCPLKLVPLVVYLVSLQHRHYLQKKKRVPSMSFLIQDVVFRH